MTALLLLLVIAINGGVFTGTVLYTAYKASKMDNIISIAEKLWQNSSIM